MKTLIFLCSLLCYTCFAQPIPADSLYLGQAPPGHTPKIFVLPINGNFRPIERISISNDGKEIYYGQLNSYSNPVLKIFYYKYYDNRWQSPFELFNGYMAPALSPNDSVLYIQASLSYDQADAYYSLRTGTSWSAPLKMFHFPQQSHYTQATNLNNLFTSTNFPGSPLRDVGKVIIAGGDTTVINIGLPVCTSLDESDFFIARDESYIIHARHSPSVAGDLLISYKKSEGGWTNSKSLGSHINLPNPTWEYGPFVTHDGKYLFFTRGNNAWNSYFTYWVKIDNIIDSLRHTNFAPYLKNQIPNQSDTAWNQFSYTIPDSTFFDDDGGALTYSAALSSGAILPSWLSFDSLTRTFSGTPTTSGTFNLRVTAVDTAGASAICLFTLNVINHIGIEPINENNPKQYRLLQNYPNPFNPKTDIEFDIPSTSLAKLTIYDACGRETATLVSELLTGGRYRVSLNAENLSSGIYFYKLESDNFTQTRKMILLK
ncbi:MAG: putative Ig domain-containing protein [Ignavibacteria bacterium]|nr:putative Ig domain-containing protein [Ignavibacteria bacterium]